MRTSLLVTICFLLFPAVSGLGQDARADIERINKLYMRQRFELRLEYKVYANHTDEQAMQIENGVVRKNGDQLYYKVGPIEAIQQKEYSVVTDHEDKTIALLPREYNAGRKELFPLPLDSLLMLCKKVEYEKLGADMSLYTLQFTFSAFDLIKVTFHPKSYQLHKIALYYHEAVDLTGEEGAPKQAPKMEIAYKDFELNPSFKQEQFTYDYFLVKSGNEYKPKALYQDYKVINQM